MRWGPNNTPKKGHSRSPPDYSTQVLWQTAGWIMLPLGMKTDFSPGHTVLDGHPTPPPHKGHSSHLTLLVSKVMIREAMTGDSTSVLVPAVASASDLLLSPKKGQSSPLLFGPCLLRPNGRPSPLLRSTCIHFNCSACFSQYFSTPSVSFANSHSEICTLEEEIYTEQARGINEVWERVTINVV